MGLTNFNNIKAAEVQLALETIWRDPQYAKSYTPYSNTVRSILEFQTANLSFLENPTQDREYSLKWVDFCTDTSDDTVDDTDDCANEKCGEGAANKQDLAPDIFIKDCYSVDQEELRSASEAGNYDSVVALGLASKIKNIIENFNVKAVAVVAANAGTNPYPKNYAYASNLTDIPKDDYNGSTLIPYFIMVSKYNKTLGAYLLDGGQLFSDYFLATNGATADNGVGINNLYRNFPYRDDVWGFSANDLEDYTYLIDKGAVAIANRSKWPDLGTLARAEDGGWQHTATGSFMRYSIPVNISDLAPITIIQGVGAPTRQALRLDVQYAVICHTDGKLYPTWNLKLRAGVYTNPLRCLTGNTGIVAFNQVAA